MFVAGATVIRDVQQQSLWRKRPNLITGACTHLDAILNVLILQFDERPPQLHSLTEVFHYFPPNLFSSMMARRNIRYLRMVVDRKLEPGQVLGGMVLIVIIVIVWGAHEAAAETTNLEMCTTYA